MPLAASEVDSHVHDPKDSKLQTTFDAAGRKTQTVEDYGGLARTTQFTYTLDNQIATLKALSSSTGDQTTTYTYGTTLSDSAVASNALLRYVEYADSVSYSDRVAMTYNRLGQEGRPIWTRPAPRTRSTRSRRSPPRPGPTGPIPPMTRPGTPHPALLLSVITSLQMPRPSVNCLTSGKTPVHRECGGGSM
jgi:hypothetical protein